MSQKGPLHRVKGRGRGCRLVRKTGGRERERGRETGGNSQPGVEGAVSCYQKTVGER